MEICSKFNSKYQVAPGKLFEKPRGVGVGGSKWEGSCGKWVCVCVCVCGLLIVPEISECLIVSA